MFDCKPSYIGIADFVFRRKKMQKMLLKVTVFVFVGDSKSIYPEAEKRRAFPEQQNKQNVVQFITGSRQL